MKNSNFKSMFNKLVNNKMTLYIVALIAFLSLYRYIMNSEFSAVLLFFLTGLITYKFTKNMAIVLGTSFLVTSLTNISKDVFKFQEGFKEGADGEEGEEGEEEEDSPVSPDPNNPIIDPPSEEDSPVSPDPNKPIIDPPSEQDGEAFKNRKSKKSGYQNQVKLNPSLYNMPNKEQMQKQLGKATEMEQAYDNLEKIMGKDNIKSISTDTKDLIKQQNELIKQLKTMTPALNDAMASLGNLDLGKLSNMFNSATKNLSELKSNE